jgi:hypothetical protein
MESAGSFQDAKTGKEDFQRLGARSIEHPRGCLPSIQREQEPGGKRTVGTGP